MIEICKPIVEADGDVLIAALLDSEDVTDFYVRPGTPIPEEFRAGNMIIQTQIVVSSIRKNEDYLGKMQFSHIHMGKADVLHIPLGPTKVLVAVLKPQDIKNKSVSKVLQKTQELSKALTA